MIKLMPNLYLIDAQVKLGFWGRCLSLLNAPYQVNASYLQVVATIIWTITVDIIQ